MSGKDSLEQPIAVPGVESGTKHRRFLGIAALIFVYAVAVLLLLIPALFLATGIQELGSKLGLWIGEPTSNDGEETWGTAIGAIAFIVVLSGAGCASWLLARWCGLRPWWTVGVASGTIALAFAMLMFAVFT